MPSLSRLTVRFRYTGFARLPYLDIESACCFRTGRGTHTRLKFLDSKLPSLAMTANGLVDSSISTTANKADDFVPVYDPNFALIPHIGANTTIRRIYRSYQ